jgi:hypothetical protein
MEKKDWKDRLLLENEETREYFEWFIEREIRRAEARAFRDGLNIASRFTNSVLKRKQKDSKKIDLLFREIFNKLRFDGIFLSFPAEDIEDMEVIKTNLETMSEHLDKIRYSEEVIRELSLGMARSIQDDALHIHRESPELSLAECYRIAVLKMFEIYS